MLNKISSSNDPPSEAAPKEGELYKTVTAFGHTFELRYGYYEDTDRHTEPVVIYPDLKKHPIYTENGEPVVTVVQDSCEYFRMNGRGRRTLDSTCSECVFFRQGEEWFARCCCENKKHNETPDGTRPTYNRKEQA